MSSEELDALLAEMEPEIRAAERDLREIDMLEKRGVLGAGKLPGKFKSSYRTCIRSFIILYRSRSSPTTFRRTTESPHRRYRNSN